MTKISYMEDHDFNTGKVYTRGTHRYHCITEKTEIVTPTVYNGFCMNMGQCEYIGIP